MIRPMYTIRHLVACAVLIAVSGTAPAQVLALSGARIIPCVGPEIADGVLVVESGKIKAVGPRGTLVIPDGATVVDVTGKVILPGFVDTHSHVGVAEGGGRSTPHQGQYDE